MTSDFDRAYLARFVFPYRRRNNIDAPSEIEDSGFTLGAEQDLVLKMEEDKCLWARKLHTVLQAQKKSIDIQFVRVHRDFLVALVAVVWKMREKGIVMFTSMAMKISAIGFEHCFSDLYHNSHFGGTPEHNSDGTVAYILKSTTAKPHSFFITKDCATSFDKIVFQCSTLQECVDFANSLKNGKLDV